MLEFGGFMSCFLQGACPSVARRGRGTSELGGDSGWLSRRLEVGETE